MIIYQSCVMKKITFLYNNFVCMNINKTRCNLFLSVQLEFKITFLYDDFIGMKMNERRCHLFHSIQFEFDICSEMIHFVFFQIVEPLD